MGQIYGAAPEADGDVYHIFAYDTGVKFKILGTMREVFDHFTKEYAELIREFVDLKEGSTEGENPPKSSEVAFCARNNAGIYFEDFPGGIAMYAETGKAFSIIEAVFNPEYVQWKEDNRALMDSDPAAFFQKMKEYLGF
jgi:hypothetical protein